MKKVILIIVWLLGLVPAISYAGIFPDGKKFEFIGILSFLIVALGAIFIYYMVWKSKQSLASYKKDRYVIRSVQITSNGRTYVKSKKVKVQEEQDRKKSPDSGKKAGPKRDG